MPVIYYNIDEQISLEKEPYKSLTKRFKSLKNALEEKEIELNIGADREGFAKGFYTDFEFTNDAKVKFLFSKEADAGTKEKAQIFVRMVFSFECNESNLHYYRRHIKLLKKRIPYFYIPEATHFAFSSQIDDEFNMQFDVLVEKEDKVLQVCYSLLNQIIAILSFED